jgi:small subunit ribosomal protein S21
MATDPERGWRVQKIATHPVSTHERLVYKLLAFCGFCGILSTGQQAGFGGVFALAEIRVQEGEPLENALRRFKRKVQTEDIIKEVKRHSFYLKPGEKKRVKEALARKRNRKKIRKEQD